MPDEVEGELSLQEEQVPQIWWKRWVNSSKDGNDVILEGSDGAFGPVAMVHVRRDKLELGTPRKGDCLFEGSSGFIVYDLEINRQTPCSQTSHDDVVGSKTMSIVLGFERLLEDQVAICMVRNHDILVAQACPDRETTCVVGIELAEREHIDKDFVRGKFQGRGFNSREGQASRSPRQTWPC